MGVASCKKIYSVETGNESLANSDQCRKTIIGKSQDKENMNNESDRKFFVSRKNLITCMQRICSMSFI